MENNSPADSLLFADLILPVPIPKRFTYLVPEDMHADITEGARVVVAFGRQPVVTGVVERLHHTAPEAYEPKPIDELLDTQAIMHRRQFDLYDWMASYYLCTIGEVMAAALPSGLKLSTESFIQLHPHADAEAAMPDLSDKEVLLIDALLDQQVISYQDAAAILQIKSYPRILKILLEKGLILTYQEKRERFAPKTENRLRLAEEYAEDPGMLEALLPELERAPKQTDAVMKYLALVPVLQRPGANVAGIAKKSLTEADISPAAIRTLIQKEIFQEFKVTISRFGDLPEADQALPVLSELQAGARDEIIHLFDSKEAVLLHGITGSGKTEIYMDLIAKVLEQGQQVLYLLPEIALTTQIVRRLQAVFGERLGIYHSRHSANERVETWKGVLEGRFDFIVGVRSTVFLPFDNLGLVIVDEEHEPSYKQFDPAPRYHARDVALMLARQHHAKVLLGSATPSMETYALAIRNRIGYVELSSRYGEASLPDIHLVDTRLARKQKKMHGEFSPQLVEALTETFERKEQAIIFQNRRGYSYFISCEDCGWIPTCRQCAVSLTYHQFRNEMKCHYCGYKEKQPGVCPACGSAKLKTVGLGTEKLEEEIKLLLPEARVQRMDLDTTRTKYSFQQILEDFGQGYVDVLVGTQMVSKGLDFDNVSLVAVFDADRMLHFPDFRSQERTYHLISQVSGRAGRKNIAGRVIVQTGNPMQPLLQQVAAHDYQRMAELELDERKKYAYPPYVRLVKVTLKHADRERVEKAAQNLASLFRAAIDPQRVLGPVEPGIAKLRNQWLMEITIKLERDPGKGAAAKERLRQEVISLQQNKAYRSVQVVFDVDPV
ncbi:primosomal protein N' [Roseivirga sp. BDSF3-8]|uniref:replication restart helicase PriA n=1 Tax=Roseivirga sp. BDSF3-8 TaxID=3241598 RepID=UPI00353227E6